MKMGIMVYAEPSSRHSPLGCRGSEHWPTPPHALQGNVKLRAGMPCFHVEGLAFEKCWKEKGSILRRKTKEELLKF